MLRNDFSVRRASAVTAQRNNSGTATIQKRICKDRIFCAMVAYGNGSRPCRVDQIEISAMHNTEMLRPPEPNRIAAQSSKGKGAYKSAGAEAGEMGWAVNTNKLTATIPIASIPASQHRARVAFRIHEGPLEIPSTIRGTIVSSAKAFVQNRSVSNGQ